MRSALLAALLLLAAPTAWATNKCTDANGKVTYQDRPCGTAKAVKVDTAPNSVDGRPNPAVVKEMKEFDRKVADRVRADADQRSARQQRLAAFQQLCQGHLDDAERQRAWLTSISDSAKASAEAEIRIANRKYHEDGCDNPNAVP